MFGNTGFLPRLAVVGTYLDGAEAEVAAEGDTQTSEEDWWTERSAMLDRVFDADRFPVSTRLAAEGVFDGASDAEDYLANEIRTTFEFGLERVLDGIAVLVAERTITS